MDENLVDHASLVDVNYKFDFSEDDQLSFDVNVDLSSSLIKTYSNSKPEWAKLDVHKCENCPLNSEEFPYCPAALSFVDIVEKFSEKKRDRTAEITVTLPEKRVQAQKGTQEGLASLIGLRMATSLCPYLNRFRLMARFHEPFSTPYYTVYRSTSMYLLKQYFKYKNGETPDWELKELKNFYDIISKINLKMSHRLHEAGDIGEHSIQVLSIFSMSMTLLFEEYLKVIEHLNNFSLPSS